MSELDQEIKDHEYDGIKEYDNPLPNWWLITFFGTIIFAFIYFIHYQLGGGPTQSEELQAALDQVQQIKTAQPQVQESAEDLLALFAKPEIVANGSKVFAANCLACHGAELQGQIGPNLTDNYWLHGKGTPLDILNNVRNGVPEKGMPAWGPVLKREDVLAAAAFVFSKIGSQPPHPKAPQGELVQ